MFGHRTSLVIWELGLLHSSLPNDCNIGHVVVEVGLWPSFIPNDWLVMFVFVYGIGYWDLGPVLLALELQPSFSLNKKLWLASGHG